MRQMSDGERELWNEMQRDAAPDVRTIAIRTATRRGPPILCDNCGAPINPGDRYGSHVFTEDGRFELTRYHTPCPPDAAEQAAEVDRQREQAEAACYSAWTDEAGA